MRIRIDARAFRALMATAEKERSHRITARPQLHTVHIDTQAGVMVATDGRALLRIAYDVVDIHDTPIPDSRTYKLSGVKLPNKNADTVIIDLAAHTMEVLFHTGRLLFVSALELWDRSGSLGFPDYTRHIPKASEVIARAEKIGVDPELLARVSRELGDGVLLEFTKERAPTLCRIYATFPLYRKHDAVMVVMQLRLD